jgi:hypothetical protein
MLNWREGGIRTHVLLEIASAFLVCGEWKSSYSQAHNGTLTARIVARGGNNLATFSLSA